MIATRSSLPPGEVRGVNVILRRDGSEVHLDDIPTADAGQQILDEIDGAILAIEAQLDQVDGSEEWRRRALTALKVKRRSRPALQQRIAVLRKAEKAAIPLGERSTSHKDGQRRAFVQAATELLDHELVTEIWTRAEELRPSAFSYPEGVSV